MSKEITYTKVIDLIQKKQFDAASIEAGRLKRNVPGSIQLVLLSIYCKMECGQLRGASILVSNALKATPDHQLLHETATYLKALKSGEKLKNPLAEFIHAFTLYTHSNIPTDQHTFDSFMHQLLIKPFIK